MKVVLAALPAFGHVYPLVPLGLALERAGATVVLATGAEFAGRVPLRTVVGAEQSWSFAEAMAEIGRRIERGGLGPDAPVGRMLFVELCAPHVVDVMTEVLQRESPDVVVFEQTDVGAAIAAHRASIRAYCQAIVGWGNQWSDIYTATAAIVPTPSPGALAEALIDPHPPFLQDTRATPPFPTLAMRPTAWSPDRPIPPWLLEPRRAPRVYVTMGTVFGTEELLRTTALAVAGTGCEVLVATGPRTSPGALGGMPATVHVEQEVPQAQLLPHVDVVVHHGGTGTVIGALAHGLPQVVPQGADQFWNADHIAAEGAGRAVLPGAPPSTVAAAVTAMVEEAAPERRAARRLGDVIEQMPSPESVAALLTAEGDRT